MLQNSKLIERLHLRKSRRYGSYTPNGGSTESHAENVKSPKPRQWYANCSTRFNSFRIQHQAINEALTREARGLPRFTGEDKRGNPVVRMYMPKVGQGYIPNVNDRENPIFQSEINVFEVRFDYETLRPVTAYPVGGFDADASVS